MNARRTASAIVLVLLIIGAVAVLGPGTAAWARPGQLAQTVPTPTPTSSEPSEPLPTATPVEPTPAPPPTNTPAIPPAAEEVVSPDQPNTSTTVQPAASPTPPSPTPELTLELVAEPPWAIPGRAITFRLAVRNTGPIEATDVIVRDELPELVVLRSAESDQGEVIVEGQVVRAHVERLATGATWTLTIQGEIPPDAPLGEIIDNIIEVRSAGGFRSSSGISVALPPAELSPTGGCFPS